MPAVTFHWTLHLSNGDNVERSWSPDPGYASTAWSPERIAAGTPFGYQESWHWDSDPVYGVHPLQNATISRRLLSAGGSLSWVGSGNDLNHQGILAPSGYINWSVRLYLEWVQDITGTPEDDLANFELWYELWFALGSMSMQDQRALYETLETYPIPPNGFDAPSEAGYYLKEFLLTTQPRWVCRNEIPCHLA